LMQPPHSVARKWSICLPREHQSIFVVFIAS
jgi:hypothetical protein